MRTIDMKQGMILKDRRDGTYAEVISNFDNIIKIIREGNRHYEIIPRYEAKYYADGSDYYED